MGNNLSIEKWKPHRDIPGVTTTPLIFSDEIAKNFQIIIDIGIKVIYDADDEYINNKQNSINYDGDPDDDVKYQKYQSYPILIMMDYLMTLKQRMMKSVSIH